jgi:hypothetical protein
MADITRALSLWHNIVKKPPNTVLVSFLVLAAGLLVLELDGLIQRSGTVCQALPATVPSPTMVRSVSGSESRMAKSQAPEEVTKNQKIDRQPRLAFRAAAMTGPMLGAEFVLVLSEFRGRCRCNQLTRGRRHQYKNLSPRVL